MLGIMTLWKLTLVVPFKRSIEQDAEAINKRRNNHIWSHVWQRWLSCIKLGPLTPIAYGMQSGILGLWGISVAVWGPTFRWRTQTFIPAEWVWLSIQYLECNFVWGNEVYTHICTPRGIYALQRSMHSARLPNITCFKSLLPETSH